MTASEKSGESINKKIKLSLSYLIEQYEPLYKG